MLYVTLLFSVDLLLYITFVTVCNVLFLNILCPVIRQTKHWHLPTNIFSGSFVPALDFVQMFILRGIL